MCIRDRLADLGITDVAIKNSQGKIPVITTTHRIMNEDGTTEYFQLLMEQESAGTQHFFARIGGWLQALEKGALLVVDEIEDSLHPLLTRRLIEMVQDKTINTKGAQLIFTTHDAMPVSYTHLDVYKRQGTDRTILSGIHAFYEPEELVGKTLIAITNLPPRAMMGIESCGMLLSAIHEEEGEEKLHLLMVDNHIPAGAKLY